jgi:hypothetical protein
LAHFVPGMLLSPLRLITYIYPLLLEYNDTWKYLNIGVKWLAKTKTLFHINKVYSPILCSSIVARNTRTKCDKCGKIVDGGRRKLNQHKRECHSYWNYINLNNRRRLNQTSSHKPWLSLGLSAASFQDPDRFSALWYLEMLPQETQRIMNNAKVGLSLGPSLRVAYAN